MIKKFIQMIGVSMFIVVSTPALSDTIETVKSRGILNCGVNTGLPGFSGIDSNGIWQGLDVDFCRSVAAAVLGDSAKVRFVPLNVTQRFVALQSGEIDVLSRNTTWTLTRDTQLGLSATTINFHDGVGFMVRSKEKNLSIKDLNQSTICMLSGISSAQNVNDLFKSKNLKYTVIFFEDLKTAVSAYDSGRCNVYSNDKSQLASIRATMLKNSEDHSILNDIVVKSPLGPMVRQGDEK